MEACLSRRTLFARPAPTPGTPPMAVITAACLAENGAYCRTCADACPEGAIRFHLLPRGRARADVDTDRCNGCGDCLPPCPADAIRLSGAKEETHGQ
ncbi:MAG: 4Fe-4S binding protein [Niveispirillum sp.]|nr:4Fe-4S binding protein [Niveispirillum sp.]